MAASQFCELVEEAEPEAGECPICYGDEEVLLQLGLCGHCACRLCTLRTIRMLLKEGAVSLPCPACDGNKPAGAGGAGGSGAKFTAITGRGFISHSCVLAVQKWSGGAALPEGERALSKVEVERFNEMLVSSALAAAGAEALITCPNAKCGERIASDATEPQSMRCPSCAMSMCGACGRGWEKHKGLTCEALASASAGEEALATGEVAGSFKRCPKCGAGVQHLAGHGCHHITCGTAGCGAHWCYICLGPFPCTSGCPGWCGVGATALCDCWQCTECKRPKKHGKKSACNACSGAAGGCMTCAGASDAAIAAAKVASLKAIAKKMSGGWCGPRTVPPAGVPKEAYKPSFRPEALAQHGFGGGGAAYGLGGVAALAAGAVAALGAAFGIGAPSAPAPPAQQARPLGVAPTGPRPGSWRALGPRPPRGGRGGHR